MKEKIAKLVDSSIAEFHVYVDDAYTEIVEGKKILNIVLDSDEVIDLNKVTDASRVINKMMDEDKELLDDCDELDIFSKEKGE